MKKFYVTSKRSKRYKVLLRLKFFYSQILQWNKSLSVYVLNVLGFSYKVSEIRILTIYIKMLDAPRNTLENI